MRAARRDQEIERELCEIRNKIDALYWTFTRTRRGKPPVLVRPDLYARQRALLDERATRIAAKVARRSR